METKTFKNQGRKSWFFEKINNIDKSLGKLTKRRKFQLTKLEMKGGYHNK
jgi:hypothetical protein